MSEKLQNIELRSEEVQDILSKVPNWMIRWGNTIFLILIMMIVLLSWLVKYPDIITSQAIITTEIAPQKIYVRTTGKLQKIFVENGELVKKNETLGIIENTATYKDVQFLKSIIDTLRIRKDLINFPWKHIRPLSLGEIDADYNEFESNYLRFKLNSQLEPYSNQLSSERIVNFELNSRLEILNSQLEKNFSELELQKKNFQRHQTLFEKGVISKMEFERQQGELLNALRNRENLNYSLSQVKEEISLSAYDSRDIKISREIEEQVLYTNVIQSLKVLKRSIRNWEIQYLLVADVPGFVSFFNHMNVNQKVTQGDLLFTIIPKKRSNYVARLKTPSKNSGKLEINQKVSIKLDNYPDVEFGVLTGSISSISPITDHEGFYHIDVKILNLTTTYNKKVEFKHEMTGVAEIMTQDLRLFERIFFQIKDLVSSDS